MKTRCLIPLMVVAAFMLMSQPAIADDLADLKATYMRMVKAYNSGDLETAFEIMGDNAIRITYLHAFPMVMRDKARVKQLWAKWWETHSIRVIPYKIDYRVIGNTGLVWSVLESNRISKKGEPTQRWFLRISYTFVKSDGKWKWVLAHYSPIPTTQTIY